MELHGGYNIIIDRRKNIELYFAVKQRVGGMVYNYYEVHLEYFLAQLGLFETFVILKSHTKVNFIIFE